MKIFRELIKFRISISILMAFVLSPLLFTSCDSNTTVVEEYYDFNYDMVFYNILPGDWTALAFNEYVWGQDTDLINQDIINNGMVLFYYRNVNDGEFWRQMPSTELYFDDVNPEFNYSKEFHPFHDPNGFEVKYFATDPQLLRPIDYVIELKVVVIDNSFTNVRSNISEEQNSGIYQDIPHEELILILKENGSKILNR